jgi:hypothetical protein
MKLEGVLDCLEFALESEWETDGAESVPDELKDALTMMERGRRLLREGLRVPELIADDAAADEEYRAVARNGDIIPGDVLALMHREREAVEREASKDYNGSL